ncbi:MAG: radical SAM protein [Polyangia bacterium]
MRLLLITPPMTQMNTPYPATAYLTGCLRRHAPDVEVVQADFSLELFLRLFSRAGLQQILDELSARARRIVGRGQGRGRRAAEAPPMPPAIARFLLQGEDYVAAIEPVLRFLQGRDPSLALRIASRRFLPEGPRFAAALPHPAAPAAPEIRDDDPIGWAFGELGTTDRARHLASLFIDDLADVVREGIDPRFELSRYGEKLAESAPSFTALAAALDEEPTLIDQHLDELTRAALKDHAPDLVGLTVPFPGNVYGALRIARRIKAERPQIRIVLGGGYVNTELRQLREPRLFDLVDYVTLDDGERPLLALLAHLRDPAQPLLRTYVRERGRVVLRTSPELCDLPHRDTGTPTYAGLPLDRYVSLFEMLNPMHRLWSEVRWNKLTVAKGCYWKKCTFCDLSLDYIGRYEPAAADVLVDRIEELVRETGTTGFHFVDEAAPPAALRALAERLIERRLSITWWGNIRFEKAFTPELVALLARSGCVAVSGGLEVASDRLLKLMQKGVTVAQVARVARAFSDAGVLVHAYLMYGFPTQTEQETIDSLERVRQLFAEGCIQSGFWHRFAATAHSPIGQKPELFGIRLLREPRITFARNEVPFTDPTGCDHERLGHGLRKALYNFMHGIGLEKDVRVWFDAAPADDSNDAGPRRRPSRSLRSALPPAAVPRDFIRRALHESA